MKNISEFILILMAVITLTRGAEEIYAQEGGNITLRPPASADLQSHYVYWYVNGKECALCNPLGRREVTEGFTNRLFLSDGCLLTITNFSKEYYGIASCEVKLLRVTQATVVYEVLKVTVNMNSLSPLLHGETLSLVCDPQTPQSGKKPHIHWLSPQGEKMKNQGQLTVRAEAQYNGTWTCVVSSDGKESTAKISVMVLDLSPAPSSPQYTSESSPLNIPCLIPEHISWEQMKAKGIQGGHWTFIPKPGTTPTSADPQRLFYLSLEDPISWKEVEAKKLTLADPKTKNLSLTRNKGSNKDGGDYVCTLEFKNSANLSRTVHVEVLQITASPGTELISGQRLNLTCGVGHPLPSNLHLKWSPPKQSPLSLTPDRHPPHLTIPEVGRGDGGKWRCELRQNSTSLCSADITLKIEPRVSVWMLVIIISVAVIVILLLILVFILCRRRQRKTRHLRHRLCQCKNPKPKGFYRT